MSAIKSPPKAPPSNPAPQPIPNLFFSGDCCTCTGDGWVLMNIGVLYTGDWRSETEEAETIRSKANKIKKKIGVLRERKRVKGVAGVSLLLLGLRFENQRM
jgi:hypothetical protein